MYFLNYILLLGIWTGENYRLKVIYINRRRDFWRNKMEHKLISFFHNCLLPELVDPRHPRGLSIREPDYILKAREDKQKKVMVGQD